VQHDKVTSLTATVSTRGPLCANMRRPQFPQTRSACQRSATPPAENRWPQVSSALHPSGVVKSSTSFGWGKGGNITSTGWQLGGLTLCDPIWHPSSRGGEAIVAITAILCLPYLAQKLPKIGRIIPDGRGQTNANMLITTLRHPYLA